ncbi:MAG: hypothetical protein JRE27_00435 [Deltaproteobacteria bacterium]|nr:hypothetical protein [Deltaproteobacteria bacterium]
MGFSFGPRRSIYCDISVVLEEEGSPISKTELRHFEQFDLIYRSLCALLFNYVPTSGHPGGSISSGRFVAGLLFDAMDYDIADPDRDDADLISYAAGHKALGLYAMWALRNEVIRIEAPDLLPSNHRLQLRLEDLLGFRRNPITKTPLFIQFNAKPLDGHPTPATPFIRLSTGASGVGMGTSLGLAFGARDYYGQQAPWVHIVEGEGGMTPGRISEAMAAAGTACLRNTVLHVDWNQASIDSNHVCRDGDVPGDYVQWNPMELAYLHDWNVILVPDGTDFQQVIAAQRKAVCLDNNQPTAVVYRTTKGWRYGIEGKASHGAGHNLCTNEFYAALKPLMDTASVQLPCCEDGKQRCTGGARAEIIEECLWEALTIIRMTLENNRETTGMMAQRLVDARNRLNSHNRQPRKDKPSIDVVFTTAAKSAAVVPDNLKLAPGITTTLRGELGRVLHLYNKLSNGALFAASADLLGSTSVNVIGQEFPEGYYNAVTNPGSRVMATGGICEDGMSGILSGLSTFGHHIGVGSSYGAFIAALGHITSRLHAIGNQARQAIKEEPYKTFILVCAHAGLKTGEDGPTHADPQALLLLQENFPLGTVITLTPWDPAEIWSLTSAALAARPAVIAPFVTRPNETILDRAAAGLAPVDTVVTGVYQLRRSEGNAEGTLVLQGSDVAYAFIEETMPLLAVKGTDLDVFYVASAELFDLLPAYEQERIFPDSLAQSAMGITGFTLPTLYKWIRSQYGLSMSLHPFQKGHYLGSGQAHMVLAEAGLDGESQFKAIMHYIENR